MLKWIFAIALAGLLVGCAQIATDYKTGKETPLGPNEISPQQQASTLANTLSGIPYANLAAPIIALGFPYILTWLRGRRLRKQMATSQNPITGDLGHKIGLEGIVQHFADLAKGLFSVGQPGSIVNAGWKIGIIGTLGSLAAPYLTHILDGIINLLTIHPPTWIPTAAIPLAIAGVGILENWLSKVLPIAKPVETSTSSSSTLTFD